MAGADNRRNSTPVFPFKGFSQFDTKRKSTKLLCHGLKPVPNHPLALLENNTTILVKLNMFSIEFVNRWLDGIYFLFYLLNCKLLLGHRG
jgi:hypothetical protein